MWETALKETYCIFLLAVYTKAIGLYFKTCHGSFKKVFFKLLNNMKGLFNLLSNVVFIKLILNFLFRNKEFEKPALDPQVAEFAFFV